MMVESPLLMIQAKLTFGCAKENYQNLFITSRHPNWHKMVVSAAGPGDDEGRVEGVVLVATL